MLSKIEVLYPDHLIPIRIDYKMLKKKYPQIYEKNKLRLESPKSEDELVYELERQVIENTTLQIEAVRLHNYDGSITVLNNADFMKWSGPFCDGYYIYSDSKYVYFLISIAEMQAGSLGIWSIKANNWVFNHRDELFCVQSVIYIDDLDTFFGYIIWDYPCTPHGDEQLFAIGPERSYVKSNLKPIEDFNDWGSLELNKKSSFSNFQDSYLGYDSKKKILVTVSFGVNLAYQL